LIGGPAHGAVSQSLDGSLTFTPEAAYFGADALVVRVTDGNDRQIDNGKTTPDRQQIIAGVVDQPLAGQMLRLDLVRVKAK